MNTDVTAFRLGEIAVFVLPEPFCIIPESTSSIQSPWIEDILVPGKMKLSNLLKAVT